MGLNWVFGTDYTGFKEVKAPLSNFISDKGTVVKYDGKILTLNTSATTPTAGDQFRIHSDGNIYITIADTDSGWGETYTPTAQEMQAYFYGWRMNNGTFGTAYNGTGTKTWVRWNATDNSASTTTCPVSNPNTDGYTPYKLLYQLANPMQEVVQTEGLFPSLSSGANQVELGEAVVVREQAHPVKDAQGWWINIQNSTLAGNQLSYRVEKILSVYRKGSPDTIFKVNTNSAYMNGKQALFANSNDYNGIDPITVTYIAQPYQLSSSILSLDGSYESNLRKDVDRNTQNISDLGERLSAVELTKANRNQPSYINVTGFMNGWVNFGGTDAVAAYFLDEFGFVNIKARIKSGTIGQIAWYMPQGYRVKETQRFAQSSNGAFGEVVVNPDGSIVPAVGSNVSFNVQLRYKAEQ